jgi:ferredoxin-thioredoxin reductase catalytic chain
MAVNAFVESDVDEALKIIDGDHNIGTEAEVLRIWEDFARQSGLSLNEDREMVETLAKGVLENQKSHGLRYCPCRITTGDFEKDLRLVCPCNFTAQKTWKERGECWCGLFVKR